MVERGGLENRYTRKGIGGSNPSPAEKPKFSAGQETGWAKGWTIVSRDRYLEIHALAA